MCILPEGIHNLRITFISRKNKIGSTGIQGQHNAIIKGIFIDTHLLSGFIFTNSINGSKKHIEQAGYTPYN